MKVETAIWTRRHGWAAGMPVPDERDSIALVFGHPQMVGHPQRPLQKFLEVWQDKAVLGCSTAGHFVGDELLDADSLVTCIARFDRTSVRSASVNLAAAGGSRAAGRELGIKLARMRLQSVFVLGSGAEIVPSAVVAGINEVLPGVLISGALAASRVRSVPAWVITEVGPADGQLTGFGLLGDDLSVGFGSANGWDGFGPERMVTRAEGNVLYELDGRSALAVYREYLGELAAELPDSALLFPLAVRDDEGDVAVRTAWQIDERGQGLRCSEPFVEGTKVQLTRASQDRLVESAHVAGLKAATTHESLCIATACVGRRFALGMHTEEELVALQSALANSATLVGFYGYGEFTTFGANMRLLNQSMTVTTVGEVLAA